MQGIRKQLTLYAAFISEAPGESTGPCCNLDGVKVGSMSWEGEKKGASLSLTS